MDKSITFTFDERCLLVRAIICFEDAIKAEMPMAGIYATDDTKHKALQDLEALYQKIAMP